MRVRIDDHFARASLRARAARSAALQVGAELILEEANRTVPIEEGTLQRSGKTTVSGSEAAISYDTPYAVRQHEDTRLRHDPGRRAKWLQLALTEHAPRALQLVAVEFQKRFLA